MQGTPSAAAPTSPPARFQINVKASDGKDGRLTLEVNAERTAVTANIVFKGETDKKPIASIRTHFDSSKLPRIIAENPAAFTAQLKPSKHPAGSYKLSLTYTGASLAPAASSPNSPSEQGTIAKAPPPEAIATELYPAQGLDLFSMRDGRDLLSAKRKGRFDDDMKLILKFMIDRFKALTDARSEFVTEMATIGEGADFEDQKGIIHKLIKQINEAILLSVTDLEALTQIFRAIQRAQYEKALKEAVAAGNDPQTFVRNNPLYQFVPQDFLNIMEILVAKLNDITHARSLADSSKLHVAQVEVFVTLLELMEMAKVEDVERTKRHTPYYDALDRFSFHENLTIAY